MSSNSSGSSSTSSASSSNSSSNSLSYLSTSPFSSSRSNKYKDVSAMNSLDDFGTRISWTDPDALLAYNSTEDIQIFIAIRKLGKSTGTTENTVPYTSLVGSSSKTDVITSDIQTHPFVVFQISSGPYKDFAVAVELLGDNDKIRFFYTDMYKSLAIPETHKYPVCTTNTRIGFLVSFCVPKDDAIGKAQKAWYGQPYIAIGRNSKAWAHQIAQSIKGESIPVWADFVDSWGTSNEFVQYWENDINCKTAFRSGQDFSKVRAGKNPQTKYEV